MPLPHGGILRIEFSLALVDVILSLVAFGHSCRIASTCAKENSILRIPPCGKATILTEKVAETKKMSSLKIFASFDTLLGLRSVKVME